MIDAQSSSSTRPYLIRALYEWCTDNGLTPYVAVQADDSVQVPREYVKDGEIVLNISFDATSGLELGNTVISFSARFAGKARDIMIPVERVIAIYARENGQGMAFPVPSGPAAAGAAPVAAEPARSGLRLARSTDDADDADTAAAVPPEVAPADEPAPEPPAPGGGRPALKRVK